MENAIQAELVLDQDVTMSEANPTVVENSPFAVGMTSDSQGTVLAVSPSSEWQKIERSDVMSFCSDDSMRFDSDDEITLPETGQAMKPFDMGRLKACIHAGSPTLDKIAGKDVCLVIGKTGSGKSSLIQGIAGKRFKSVDHAVFSKGVTFNKIVYEAEDFLEGFEIGHEKASKTNAINCFERKTGRSDPDTMFYVDSPGFEDTNGLEVDIATSVMIGQVAKRCKSLRFIVLINYASLVENRGDAMRAVLKIIRTFVHDFEAKKTKSFAFLFSHACEFITEEDLKLAGQRLHSEIIRIDHATTDKGTKEVLRFIKMSLERKFPYVQIFHPTSFDFSRMAKFIESKLEPIENTTLAANCALTVASQSTLRGETKSQLLELKHLLSKCPADTVRVMDIMETFEYLREFVASIDVKKTADDCNECIERFCSEEKRVLDEAIDRGTSMEEQFSMTDAERLRHAMGHLSALKDFSTSQFSLHVTQRFITMKKTILSERCDSFLGVPQKLGSLQAWAHVFPEFSNVYEETLCHYNGLLTGYDTKLSDFLSIGLCKATEDDLSALAEDFNVVGSIGDSQQKLSEHELKVSTVVGSFEKVKKHVRDTITEWQHEMDHGMQSDELSLDELLEFATRSKVLVVLRAIFEGNSNCLELESKGSSLIKDITSRVVGHYQAASQKWASSSAPLDRDSFHSIQVLQKGACFFDGFHDSEWREIQYACSSILAIVRSELSQKAESVSRKSQLVGERGFYEAASDGRALLSLDDCLCFDSLFDFKDQFLKNVSTKSHRDFSDRMLKIRETVNQSLEELFDPNSDSSKALDEIKDFFGEIHQISIFASDTRNMDFASFEDTVHASLKSFLKKMDRSSQAIVKQWTKALEGQKLEKLRVETEKLEHLLRQLQQISELGVKGEADAVVLQIENALSSVNQTVQHEFESVKDFSLLASRLACAEVLHDFSIVCNFLPAFEECQQRAVDIFVEKAQEIEKLVESTSEWDVIDTLIENLEKATLIDQYVGGQVSSRLGPLRKLREKKEDDVDSALEELIEKEDFKHIGDLLAPLANSKDQLKRKKFQGYGLKITTRLKGKIDLATSLLSSALTDESVPIIGQIFEVLDHAEAEIGSHLRSEFPLRSEITRLTRLADTKLKHFLTKFAEAMKELNFVRMVMSKATAAKFVASLDDRLPVSTTKKVDGATRQYNAILRSIPVQINRFFDQGFKNGDEIAKILSGMQKAAENTHPATEELTNLYQKTADELENRLKLMLQNVERDVNERGCFDDGAALLHMLIGELEGGLNHHIESSNLLDECSSKLRVWRESAKNGEEALDFEQPDIDIKLKEFSEKLDRLRSPGVLQKMKKFLSRDSSYDKHRARLERQVDQTHSQVSKSLAAGDFLSAQKGIGALDLINNHLVAHTPQVKAILLDLKKITIERSIDILDSAVQVLNSGSDLASFERIFADIRSLILTISFVSEKPEVGKKLSLVNQLVFEILGSRVKSVLTILRMESDIVDFSAVRETVENARTFGSFVADHYTLFCEEVQSSEYVTEDKWLPKIVSVCHEHFSVGRDFSKMKYFAVLGIVPSSDERAIRRAYKKKALQYHPDKSGGDTNAKFREISDAHDVLLAAVAPREKNPSRPFDQFICRVSENLRRKVHEYLKEERYDMVGRVLFSLPGLLELKDLVVPELECGRIQEGIEELVRDHVKKAKIDVETLWAERKYRDLNDTISDLRSMEDALKSHSRVFPDSWNDGIIEKIETEISRLGKAACELLSSEASAKANESEFRRSFIQMGHVLFELQSLKNYTKRAMAEVLEICLCHAWGFSYVFELGISLHRGGEDDDETSHVVHHILSEFSHFKEVLTMAWNNETTQKPAEDSVTRISAYELNRAGGPLNLDQDALLRSFEVFEAEYNILLGEYIRPDADKAALVVKVVNTCKKVKPVDCSGGWNQDVRSAIPKILGGVFALFTICKSGETFNRVESSEEASRLGQQILLKPHNIQVLTLLYMFGCSSQTDDTLESQLLQIRTGEGKSMILGAAATVFGLLGFRVRCVCYSEYLSSRDYTLFEEVFTLFGLGPRIKYSKITAFSEETTASKGDLRSLTGAFLRGKLAPKSTLRATGPKSKQLSTRETSYQQSNTRITRSRAAQTRAHNHLTDDSEEMSEDKLVETSVDSPPRDNLSFLRNTEQHSMEKEILLVDEVDVFFGSDFYGQTYNQVSQLREPEIQHILKAIWTLHKQGGRRLRLADVKKMKAYRQLVAKFPSFEFVIDNEISLMLDDVRRVDDEPYYLDSYDRIGYKVMDTISYDVTLGYRTAFAYLKEYDAGRLKEDERTLKEVLGMNVSCAQFSYADIRPSRILGVSGTLSAMGDYEKNVLRNYGITKFIYMPSVYGQSNFEFEKTGDGIFIEAGQSDYYHKICSEISKVTAKNRAAIVFFADTNKLNEFESSSFYRKLGRKKTKLSEDMDATEKDFVIKKAATAGQLTICASVFGRGTDFFCKDKKILDNGGVHIIQTFLSAEKSEEIQIQGRTARQGKRGTYQLILLDSDLEANFGVPITLRENVPKKEWYNSLCVTRDKRYDQYCKEMDESLVDATTRDKNSHSYFDALLAGDLERASLLFKDIYLSMKKKLMPACVEIDLCYVIDVTGSMSPYMKAGNETIKNLVHGNGSIETKLSAKFPDVKFKLRVGSVAFRDIEDSTHQFQESRFTKDCHFTESMSEGVGCIERFTKSPSGGFDLAEDLYGAIHSCASWNGTGDWTAMIKFIMLVTDAPAHGLVPPCSQQVVNADKFPQVHPNGLTAESVVDGLIKKGIDLFFCSFNPSATATTEEKLSKLYREHPDNIEQREISCIPMVPKKNGQNGEIALTGVQSQHIVFVLDESGSMQHEWNGVVQAYRNFLSQRLTNQSMTDLVSVVQFSCSSRVSVDKAQISVAPQCLSFASGSTYYSPAAESAKQLTLATPNSHKPVVIFMSDGVADESDALKTAQIFQSLSTQVRRRWGNELDLHVVAFGTGLDTRQLANITRSSSRGRIHTSAGAAQLSDLFVEIAQTSSDIAGVLEAEIGRRISEAVSDKVELEYLG